MVFCNSLYTVKVLLALVSAQAPPTAAPPMDPRIFAPTNRTTGLLYPNPDNPSCEVLLDIKTRNTTSPNVQEPTSSPVASSVLSDLSLQIQNLNLTAFEVTL